MLRRRVGWGGWGPADEAAARDAHVCMRAVGAAVKAAVCRMPGTFELRSSLGIVIGSGIVFALCERQVDK